MQYVKVVVKEVNTVSNLIVIDLDFAIFIVS